MPINLETGMIAGAVNDDGSTQQSTAQIKIFSPKFFHSCLTGNGKLRGLLCEAINPGVYPTGVPMTIDHTHTRRTKMTSGLTTTTMIPVNPLTYNAWDFMNTLKRPSTALLTEFGTDKQTLTKKLYLEMRPHSMVVEETDTPPNANAGQQGKSKKSVPCYQILIYLLADPNSDTHERVSAISKVRPQSKTNTYFNTFATSPVTEIEALARELDSLGFVVKFDILNTFIQTYSLYDHMVKRSEEWQSSIDVTLDEFFQNLTANKGGQPLTQAEQRIAIEVIRHIDQYPVPLDLYRNIYNKLSQYFTKDDTKTICRQNLNLLLSDTMENLNKSKPSLNAVRTPNPIPPQSKTAFAYSTEQKVAISSQEPLVLVQSGAGTGKAQPYTARIVTPYGWTTMGEIKVHDLVVGTDGLPHEVKRIHEQGVKSGYRITFTDGSQTEVCGEHLWTVLTRNPSNGSEKRQTITTEQFINSYHREKSYLPTHMVVRYGYGMRELPLDPYLTGSLIGNNQLHEHCANQLAMDMRLNTRPEEKFIPEAYKTAEVKQRQELINGLFDECGELYQGCPKLTTTSQQLAQDTAEVFWSLGLRASKQRDGDVWHVTLQDCVWDPFKKSKYAGQLTGTDELAVRKIADVTPITPVPMRCIEIDAPDKLYLTDDFIVTHNSTVILGRIDWMVANGVPPQDIMVLSFTNAAADHIKELNPNVKSMTIAHMIHTIYAANFPDHLLSELDTLVNSLDIYFPTNDIAMKFKHRCIAARNNEPNAYVDLNNFIEENYDDVINFLNTTRQTSLELEIIICYQKIDHMVEPPEIQSQHLIIDEVQDNSVFEFIYALKYVEKHKESLFIVGDCSQTLYEFRASNPRAMNVLEASGVFATHQLQVNYRSNQEILDFANIVLADIEANQYAQIQLIANSMATVTEQTFRDKVRLKYERVSKLAEIPDLILPLFGAWEIKSYIDGCLARGEKIAFLAYTKNHVRAMEDAIRTVYPGAATSNLIPIVKDPTTVLSRFIQTCWDNIKFVPTKHILQIVVNEMQNNLPKLSRNPNINTQSASYQKFAALASKTIDDWRRESARDVNDWEQQYRAGQITQDELLERVKASMLDHEIKNNKTMQSLKSGQNKKIKEMNAKSNASFIFSTIHSAKGLEFDNVILIYKDNSDMSEPDKRMYYVGLTRAMNSELVLAFNTTKTTHIKNDYDTIVAQLHQTHPMPQASNLAKTPTSPGQTPAGMSAQAVNTIAPTPVQAPTQAQAPAAPTAPAAPATPAAPGIALSPFASAPAAPAPHVIAPGTPVVPNAQPAPMPTPANPRAAAPAMPVANTTPSTMPPKSVGITDIFPNAMPGVVISVPASMPSNDSASVAMDDIQLPPGYSFLNSDGRSCVVSGSDAPGETQDKPGDGNPNDSPSEN